MLTVVTERGVEAYRIRDGGALVSLEPGNLLTGLPAPSDPTLAGSADAYGNFWVTTEGSNLLYLPGMTRRPDSAKAYRSLDGFSGVSCRNLSPDPQGHLWTGCTEGGVFEVIPGRDSTLHSFRRYGLNDGLISEIIYNLSVNPDNGDVWVTTEKGIARYESPSRPPASDLSEVKAYPNPFLPKHRVVVFDNLSAGSEVEVLTQSGEVIFRRTLSKGGAGDQVQWDGRNPAGKRVTEGVYFYVVKSPKETKHGKLIVAR
jgi:ligand-binding sensor domain-containing protein